MTTPTPTQTQTLFTLAQALHRLEAGGRADPDRYRDVVRQLADQLERQPGGAALEAVLAVAPSVAELYENVHYAHAGLCRSPLDAAVAAERLAAQALAKARTTGPAR